MLAPTALVLLPFIVLFLLIVGCCLPGAPDRRIAVLTAAVIWGLTVVLITEALSAARLLTPIWVASSWALMGVTWVIVRWKSFKEIGGLWRRPMGPIDPLSRLLLIGVAMIVVVTGGIALVAPPNNYDAMSYHMARVMQWIQYQSVAHYPTHTTRQLHRPPWAEFVILHFQLLSHGDRFANVVQWFSMVGSLLGISLITKRLGGNAFAQIGAVVVCATIPMGILQASSSQTDYAAGFWLVCFVVFALLLLAGQEALRPEWALILAGGSLGLAILTKPTAYMYALPFVLWIALSALRRDARAWLVRLSLMGCLVVLVNLGHYWRNVELYGSPIGTTVDEPCPRCGQINEAWTVPLFLSNVVRNASFHLGTPSESVNDAIEQAINGVHALLGISSNDPRVTWEQLPFWVSPPTFREDYDGNFLHVLLIAVALSSLLMLKRVRTSRLLLPYCLALVAGFIVFNLVMKWNAFNSRLQLSLFVLWSPLIGIVLSRLRWPKVANAVLLLAIVLSWPWVLFNSARPLLSPPWQFGCQRLAPDKIHCFRTATVREMPTIFSADRTQLYFVSHPELVQPYMDATHAILEQHCPQVGLVKHWNAWEYPLWVLLKDLESSPLRIEHVSVTNASGALSGQEPYRSFQPCAILSILNEGMTVRFTPSIGQIQRRPLER